MAAVLAVRQSGIFTAVVQPPLILFVAVPSAYFLFHRAEIAGIKDVLINCGYPLIERFLLMFTTSVVVLLIGMARWYFGAANRAGKATPKDAGTAVGAGLVAGLGAKVAALLNRRAADEAEAEDAEPVRRPRKHTIDRPATAARPPRERRTTNREAPTRSRHARPPHGRPRRTGAHPAPALRRPHTRDVDDVPGDSAVPPSAAHATRTGRQRSTQREYRPREWEPPEPPERPRRSEPLRGRLRAATAPYGSYEPPARRGATAEHASSVLERALPRQCRRRRQDSRLPAAVRAELTQRRAGRISRGSANTSVSLAVVTGCTVS